MNGVCAVIVTYNPEPELLKRMLNAVLPQVDDAVIVDNGSVLSVACLLAELPVMVLALGQNLGIAAGFNKGIAWAGERGYGQVLLLDQDSIPAPDMVVLLQDALTGLVTTGEPVAAVGPVAYDPGTRSKSGFAIMGPLCFRYVEAIAGEDTVLVDFMISSGSLLSMMALRKVGGMDEELFIDLVDTEWFLRAASFGFQSYGVPAALLHHGIGDGTSTLQVGGMKIGSLHQHGPLRHYYIFRNSILISRRAYVPWRWVLNNSLQLLGMFVYFSLFKPQRAEHLKMMLRGLSDGLIGRIGRFEC